MELESENERLRMLLERYVSAPVASEVFEQGIVLGGEPVYASAMFVDLYGFTALTRRLPAISLGEVGGDRRRRPHDLLGYLFVVSSDDADGVAQSDDDLDGKFERYARLSSGSGHFGGHAPVRRRGRDNPAGNSNANAPRGVGATRAPFPA